MENKNLKTLETAIEFTNNDYVAIFDDGSIVFYEHQKNTRIDVKPKDSTLYLAKILKTKEIKKIY